MIFITLLLIKYFLYFRGGKAKDLVDQKPRFFQSHAFSMAFTALFFGVSISYMFWGAFYIRQVLRVQLIPTDALFHKVCPV